MQGISYPKKAGSAAPRDDAPRSLMAFRLTAEEKRIFKRLAYERDTTMQDIFQEIIGPALEKYRDD